MRVPERQIAGHNGSPSQAAADRGPAGSLLDAALVPRRRFGQPARRIPGPLPVHSRHHHARLGVRMEDPPRATALRVSVSIF